MGVEKKIIKVLLLGVTLMFSVSCNRFFFYPTKEIVLRPDQLSLKYEETWFESDDKTLLHGWFLPAEGIARGSILFLHGNAQNISNHLASVYWLPERGYNVLMVDYRGYGQSEGRPSVEGLLADSLAAFRTLRARPDVSEDSLIILGQSLGAVFALRVASLPEVNSELKLLIADSPFTSFRDIAGEKLGQFWLTTLLRWPLLKTITSENSALEVAEMITPVPLLLIHGANDEIVPPHHSERIFERAREPKELWVVPEAEHIQSLAREEYRDKLVERIQWQLDCANKKSCVEKLDEKN